MSRKNKNNSTCVLLSYLITRWKKFTCKRFEKRKLRDFTCHATYGCFLSSMYCVKGDGSNSYLSNGMLSITIASQALHWYFTTGWQSLGGCNTKKIWRRSHFQTVGKIFDKTYLTLLKITYFHLGNFVERHSFRCVPGG